MQLRRGPVGPRPTKRSTSSRNTICYERLKRSVGAFRPGHAIQCVGRVLLDPPQWFVMAPGRAAPLDRILRPVHKWVWGDFDRRVRKLLAFAEVETDGGRDILRAAEVTPDPLLRRLYLEHAIDELHHGDLFRERGAALIRVQQTRRR